MRDVTFVRSRYDLAEGHTQIRAHLHADDRAYVEEAAARRQITVSELMRRIMDCRQEDARRAYTNEYVPMTGSRAVVAFFVSRAERERIMRDAVARDLTISRFVRRRVIESQLEGR